MSEIKIKYKEDFTPGSGTMSEVSWNNPDVRRALDLLFNIKLDETLTGIVITEMGIKAHFVRHKTSRAG